MIKNNLYAALIGLAITFATVSVPALVIDPAQCGVTLTCDTGSETSTSAILAVIEGLYPGILEMYKQDQGGGESGSYSGSYTTTFSNSPSEPEDALIEWDGPTLINCNDCWVLVKDGNHSPAWYLINLAGWDGQEDLDLQDFWPAGGAISHVSIFVRPVPVPAAALLFGSALLGLIGMKRRS